MAWRSDVTSCKSQKCRARIRWVRTLQGKPMPLDEEPISHEDAALEPRGVFFLDELARAVSWSPSMTLAGVDVGELYRTHWGTCTDQAAFKK